MNEKQEIAYKAMCQFGLVSIVNSHKDDGSVDVLFENIDNLRVTKYFTITKEGKVKYYG